MELICQASKKWLVVTSINGDNLRLMGLSDIPMITVIARNRINSVRSLLISKHLKGPLVAARYVGRFQAVRA